MPDLIEMSTIDSLLRHGGDRDTAIAVPDGPSLTYAQLRQMVDEAALRLASFGVRREDRVAIIFPNGPEAIVLFLAAARVGTACPLNPAYKEAEFRFYLEDTGARFLLAPRENGTDARKALSAESTVSASSSRTTSEMMRRIVARATAPPRLPARARKRPLRSGA